MIKKKLTEELKARWMSNWQIQQFTKSSSGDRVARFIRERVPEGYHWEQRRKDCDTYCLEYRLVADEQ